MRCRHGRATKPKQADTAGGGHFFFVYEVTCAVRKIQFVCILHLGIMGAQRGGNGQPDGMVQSQAWQPRRITGMPFMAYRAPSA